MRLTAAFCCSALILFAACASLGNARAEAAAQSATVGPDRVQIRFDRVVSDSRCPKDVQCIQAGEAVVRIVVSLSGGTANELELNTRRDGNSTIVGKYVLTLTALEPVPVSTRRTREEEFRATFILRAS
jgi:hypothetical protein